METRYSDRKKLEVFDECRGFFGCIPCFSSMSQESLDIEFVLNEFTDCCVVTPQYSSGGVGLEDSDVICVENLFCECRYNVVSVACYFCVLYQRPLCFTNRILLCPQHIFFLGLDFGNVFGGGKVCAKIFSDWSA